MTITIIKNDKIEKTFKKYFRAYATRDMEEWTNEKFSKAKEVRIDRGTSTIYIIY